jgi:hypothetical protein
MMTVSVVIDFFVWLFRFGILPFAIVSLFGCALNRAPVASQKTIADFYCGNDTQPGAYVPVRWSKDDTDETIAQTKANNAVYTEICR